MEERARSFNLSKVGILFVLLVKFMRSDLVEGAVLEPEGSNGLCNVDLSSFLPLPYGNLPDMDCKSLWNSFVIRYSQSKDHETTIILSAIYTSGWVGMGFSRDGMMLNASCMVGWVSTEGRARIRQYHVKGFTPSEIKPDEGELPLTGIPPFVAVQGARIYMAFQLKYNKTLKTQPVLLAFSTKYPHHLHLTLHDDKTAINFDFASAKDGIDTGNAADNTGDLSSSIFKDKRTHGTLGLLGWGLFLPLGAIVARYLKHKDKVWYHLHVVIQFIGFLLGVAAVIVGLSLNHKMHASVHAHKGIGIFLLVLTILQVLAFFWRPQKDGKYRKYWNWCHNWFGRICLFFGAVNIVLGIHIAGEGRAWKIGYGFLVGPILLTVIVLETLQRLKRMKESDMSPAFAMNSLHEEISL